MLRRHDIDLPGICYNELSGLIKTCDTCFVEVNSELKRACDYKVEGFEDVRIQATLAVSAREEGMQCILENHVLYCIICENNNGNCVVHSTFSMMGITEQAYPHRSKGYSVDASHRFYRYDPDQCILSGRCVEACQNLQVNETPSIDWSLDQSRVLWDGGVNARSSSCVGCGHCVTVCPCNALIEKSMLKEAGLLTNMADEIKKPLVSLTKALEPALGLKAPLSLSEAESKIREVQINRTKTVCTYCGVGCSFEIWTKGRKILKVEPTLDGPANQVSTCVKGKFGWQYANSAERITTPLVRDGDRFVETSWDEALAFVARRTSEIKSESGPDSLDFISSSKCTNEESFLMQKVARAVVGTNNIDNCSRYCQSPATLGLFRTVGVGGDSGSITDIASAGLVLIIGSNTAESHPVIATRVKRAHKLHGQKLVVVDLRKHEMAKRADLFISPKPGTDMVLLSAVAKYIVDLDRYDKGFVAEKTTQIEEYLASLDPFTLEYASEICGLKKEVIVELAEMVAEARSIAVLWAMGVTQHQKGSDTSTAISNLLLLTGNYGKPGCGAYPLRGHNNVQGASDFGSMPDYLSGYQSIEDQGTRKRFEDEWGVTLPTSKGLDNHEMVDAIYEGKLRGLYLIGEDMGIVDSNASYVRGAFEKLDLFVVQDIFFSNTAAYADVIFPASPSLEKEGTFTNTERRIQKINEVFPPLEQSRPDWRIICDVANTLSAQWSYDKPQDVMAEVARVTPIFAGVSYDRLEGFNSLQWPVDAYGGDTPTLFLNGFGFEDKKARFWPLVFEGVSEEADLEYDLHLNNGRLLEHLHEGNMTYKTQGIKDRTPSTFVEVPVGLAEERGIKDGTLVRLVSRRGSVKVRALVTDRVKDNQLYMPMNSSSNEEAINMLTSSSADVATHTPAYKELAVKLEVVEKEGRSPLPKNNFRFGKRTPNSGVMVENKWLRGDYLEPPARRKREW